MDYLTYRKQMRCLECRGRQLRRVILTTAFRLSLQELVDGGHWLGYALRRWYRKQG